MVHFVKLVHAEMAHPKENIAKIETVKRVREMLEKTKMIVNYYIEVKDKAEQVKMECALYSAQTPFIYAGKVSDLDLEAFDAERKGK